MLPIAHSVIRQAEGPFVAEVALDYEGRLIRRKRLTAGDEDFLVDLPEVTSLDDGDAFHLSNGRRIVVRAAAEPVLIVRGPLPRLAWHIGNRHTPCRIEDDRLVIRDDHVLRAMLEQLGAEVTTDRMAFAPEGGAYGLGRTFGHDHGADTDHDHLHGDHDHAHDPAPAADKGPADPGHDHGARPNMPDLG